MICLKILLDLPLPEPAVWEIFKTQMLVISYGAHRCPQIKTDIKSKEIFILLPPSSVVESERFVSGRGSSSVGLCPHIFVPFDLSIEHSRVVRKRGWAQDLPCKAATRSFIAQHNLDII